MQPLGVDEPTVIGPYRLLGRLGSGGMGRVYLGRSTGGRTVAVKIVHPHFALDEEFRARFRREVDAARRVGGAWTAPVLDADPWAPVPWVATAYAAGPSLSSAVADVGPLPAASVRALGAGLAEALAAVHELGLVHRDVKPSNVLLTLDGPLLIDFGIARAMDGTASLTSTGVSIGSPGYMAPEQILGKGAGGASDVFSLGAVLAYAATGEPPFAGDSSAALLYKVVHEEPELAASLDGELRRLVEACLAKAPGDRPAPGDVARRLAPQGAARLVAGGWLPGPLVEQVSRGAVRLLNLDAGEEAVSGPVRFDLPSVGAPETSAPAASVGSSTRGEFGPPPVMDAAPATPSTPVPPAPAFPPPAMPTGTPAVVPDPRRSPPPDAVPGPGPRPGKLAVSVAASSTPGEGGRGRRVSCTVALGVAGALAAVILVPTFAFDLLPGSGHGNEDSGDASPPSSQHSPPPAGSAVPARYLGTWQGKATVLNGTLPDGTFRLTLHKAALGDEVGTLRQTDLIGTVCDDVLTLKSVSAKELVVTSVGREGNHGGCNQTPHIVRITPAGDDLVYESQSGDEGYPEARLSRTGR